MSLYLIVAKGKQRGRVIRVKHELFLVGTDRVCQLRVRHKHVAGQHCALLLRDGKAFVQDLDSGRPTLVNGREVPPGAEWPLESGDLLKVGPLRAVVQVGEAPPPGNEVEQWAAQLLEEARRRQPAAPAPDRESGAAAVAASLLGRINRLEHGEARGKVHLMDEGGVTVGRLLAAELVDDAEVELVRREVTEAVAAKRPRRVLLDLGGVRRSSSRALAMLASLQRRLGADGVRLAVCGIDSELQPALGAIGLKKMLPCFPDRPAALAAEW